MKGLILLAALLVSTAAFAGPVEVKITSFYPISGQRNIAELCGVVTGHTKQTAVRIVADYNSSRAAVYNTFAGMDGHFCSMLVTYRGTVEVSVQNEDASSVTAVLGK